jgi:uronate dehydrogenase
MAFGRIALTGAAGRLGSALRPALAAMCDELVLIDQRAPADPTARERVHLLSLEDREALAGALRGCEAIVHFAGHPREAGWDVLLPANVTGVIHLWEGAQEAGVGRIVYASSNHAIGFYPRSQGIGEKVHPMPDSRYGLTKVFMEGLAQLYACKAGLKGFGLRIGHCSPEPTDARMLSTWIHPDDLAQLVRIGLEAEYEHEIVYGVSANSRAWWPNLRARALGYRPQHSADAFAAALEHRRSADPVAERYQGGSFASDGLAHARAGG